MSKVLEVGRDPDFNGPVRPRETNRLDQYFRSSKEGKRIAMGFRMTADDELSDKELSKNL